MFCKVCGKSDVKTGKHKRTVNENAICDRCLVTSENIAIPVLDESTVIKDISVGEFRLWIQDIISNTLQSQVAKSAEWFNTELKQVKSELATTKDDLKAAEHKIVELEGNINDLKTKLTHTTTATENNTKYLINHDRNVRKLNIILFGIPEDNALLINE